MYYDLEKQYLKILESIKKCGGFPSRYSELDIAGLIIFYGIMKKID